MMLTDPCTTPPEHGPSPDWSQSLATGAPGIALCHIARAHAGLGDWSTAHQWITTMVRNPVIADPKVCCLFRGVPAVAYVLRMAARPEYTTALRTLDRHIIALTWHRLARAHQRIQCQQPPQLREFDLMSGLTGIGAYLMQAGHLDLLSNILAYLVRLVSEPVLIDGDPMPGWWTSHSPGDRPDPAWPAGHGNLGVAHGIAGPLALLAAAMMRGIIVPGHAEAISRVCVELDRWRGGSADRPWWPGMLTPAEWTTRSVQQRGPHRPSWCYGTPGRARAQQLAALALGDRRRQHHAEHALADCVTDEQQLSQLDHTGMCHGWAGMVQATRRAAADAGADSALARLMPDLYTRFEQVLNQQAVVSDGLLDGASGITLARQRDTDAPATIVWDTCFLLAPSIG